ncbi:MAG: hypothetical protein EAZ08_07535 [Cytophagales bacterium]|nr:MAG: hypothetical protein EAZ08_07535 [Cytophagales bacterium]
MYAEIREEELKNKIAEAYFSEFDCTKIIGNIDFCVSIPHRELFAETQSLLWAEAKKESADLYKSVVQLILTIGKARTFDKILPPAFLGAFDAEKIAFIPYNTIQEIFYLNDFNWNVTPSNYESKEFGLVLEKVRQNINENSLIFYFGKDASEIHQFIKNNFISGKNSFSKIQIDKNNFIIIYNKWLQTVKPTIAVDWEMIKKSGMIDADFYLADLLSLENETLKEKLFVLLKTNYYELDRKLAESGLFTSSKTSFLDKQKAHQQFWNKYQRPPKEEYWDYIVNRRDLLVPQDVRERKGSFYTPQIWVELSQKYLADVLGENWQDEYYIWDCAAGTGNLLAGLTNKYHIFASTLDRQDVDVMKDRIQNGANLLEDHVFQFDFLNDSFEKLPKNLQDIINNSEKRKKLVMYINPPYAETAKNDTKNKERINKRGVSFTKVQLQYGELIGIATKELFAQFLARIYNEIPNSNLAHFSTLKVIQGPNFFKFRSFFKSKFMKGFVVPANTFDNVNGQFPIGFMIWELGDEKKFSHIICDVYDKQKQKIGQKKFYAYDKDLFITDWYRQYHTREVSESNIGAIGLYGSDFQHNNFIRITGCNEHPNRWTFIVKNNLIATSIYLALRHCIEHTWLNNQDQFLYPNKKWEKDKKFQNDCLTFALFHERNKISYKEGTNHWIPFTEQEVNARAKFESNFMTQFIKGKLKQEDNGTLLATEKQRTTPLEFSPEAQAVFEAGKKLWIYYHQTIYHINTLGEQRSFVNASLYDIREYFQGRNENGKMKNKSEDEKYLELIADLRDALKLLAQKIEPKVYEYEFLKG